MIRKKLVKWISVFGSVCLLLGLMGSFALAAEKELTPYEWMSLSGEDKLEYKTIVIKSYTAGGSWMEEEQYEDFNLLMDEGNLGRITQMYSKALFHISHPKIKIENIDFSVWAPIEQIMAAIAGGTAPCFYPIWLGGGPQTWIEQGLAADITELVEDWDQTPHFKENLWSSWKFSWKDGRCYGVPAQHIQPRSIIFRKDWFKEAGIFNEKGEPRPLDNWTWDDFRDIAVKLTDVKKKRWGFCYPQQVVTSDTQPGYDLAGSFGVFEPFSFATPDKSGKYTWRFTATPQLIKALQFVKDLRFKDDCMLTGVEIGFHSSYRSEFRSGRTGMIWYSNQPLYDMVTKPYLMSPTIPLKDIIGSSLPPRGSHDLRSMPYLNVQFGFNPTLSKEELRAAFEWSDWVYTTSQELDLRKNADLLPLYPPGVHPSAWILITSFLGTYKLKEVPGLPPLTEYVPADFIEIQNTFKKAPGLPEPFEYGLKLCRLSGSAEELQVVASLFQALLSDPNTTVEAELAKAAEILNKMVFNYKIEGDKEKMKAYVDALTNYYKENYPEFYESKDFEEQLSYFKIW